MWPENISAEPLVATYLAANTPAYLLKHLRNSQVVSRLGQERTPVQLAELINAILAQRERTPLDVAKAYAALVAMSLSDYSVWRHVVNALDLAALDWGVEVRQLMQSRAVPSTVTQLQQTSNAAPIIRTGEQTGSEVIPRNLPQAIVLVD